MEFGELLDKLEVDMEVVLDRFSGNENMLKKYICKFPDEKTLTELSDAYAVKNTEEAIRAVHTMKGIVATLGFKKLTDYCTVMLADLRGAQHNLDREYMDICTEYMRVSDCIRAYNSSVKQ